MRDVGISSEAPIEEQALKNLDNMQEIVEGEMLIRGSYISPKIQVPEREGAICGGRRACALGSLYLAAGIDPVLDDLGYSDLDNTAPSERYLEFQERPYLGLAYDAMNKAAEAYAFENWPDWAEHTTVMWKPPMGNGWMETVFEQAPIKPHLELPKIMSEIIELARQKIRNGEAVLPPVTA